MFASSVRVPHVISTLQEKSRTIWERSLEKNTPLERQNEGELKSSGAQTIIGPPSF
jgi:hypothetical protein